MAKERSLFGNDCEVFSLTQAYEEDDDANKVNIGLGVYRADDGECWVMPCVRKVKKNIVRNKGNKFEELDVLGDRDFCKATIAFIFGENNDKLDNDMIFCMQTISCSGALRIAAEFIFKSLNYSTAYFPDTTLENHILIFQTVGFTDIRRYRYWNKETKSIDFRGLIEDLSEGSLNSVVLFQVCAHNPTGCDPSPEQWSMIADVVQSRGFFPVFDASGVGLATGCVETDAKPLQIFATRGLEIIITGTFSKNFLIYNERIGFLIVLSKSKEYIPAIRSHMTHIAVGLYGSPIYYGMMVVKTIITDDTLYKEWKDNLLSIVNRTTDVRSTLEQELVRKRTLGDWSHISKTAGQFCLSGLTNRQVEHMILYYHIYLLKNGRISFWGITYDNVYYIADAIRKTVREYTF